MKTRMRMRTRTNMEMNLFGDIKKKSKSSTQFKSKSSTQFKSKSSTQSFVYKIPAIIGTGVVFSLTTIAVKKLIGYKEEVEVVDGVEDDVENDLLYAYKSPSYKIFRRG